MYQRRQTLVEMGWALPNKGSCPFSGSVTGWRLMGSRRVHCPVLSALQQDWHFAATWMIDLPAGWIHFVKYVLWDELPDPSVPSGWTLLIPAIPAITTIPSDCLPATLLHSSTSESTRSWNCCCGCSSCCGCHLPLYFNNWLWAQTHRRIIDRFRMHPHFTSGLIYRDFAIPFASVADTHFLANPIPRIVFKRQIYPNKR